MASNRPDCDDIKLSTTGVIFLGTPHGGTDIAGYGAFIAKVKQNDSSLVESLKTSDQDLYNLAIDFAAGYSSLAQVCFYEKVGPDYVGRLASVVRRFARVVVR